jgi:hypothetical protein
MRIASKLPGWLPFVAALVGGLVAASAATWLVEKRTSPWPIVGLVVGGVLALALTTFALAFVALQATCLVARVGLTVLLLPLVLVGRALVAVLVAIGRAAPRFSARPRGRGRLPPSGAQPLSL